MSSVRATPDRNQAKRVTFAQASGYIFEIRATVGHSRGIKVIDTAPGSDSARSPDRFIIRIGKWNGQEQYMHQDSIL